MECGRSDPAPWNATAWYGILFRESRVVVLSVCIIGSYRAQPDSWLRTIQPIISEYICGVSTFMWNIKSLWVLVHNSSKTCRVQCAVLGTRPGCCL
jgi:hypothetical protein